MALFTAHRPHLPHSERLRMLLERTWLALVQLALGTVDGTRRLVAWYAADRSRIRTTLTGVAVLLVIALGLGLGVGLALTTVTELLVATVEGALAP